MSSPSYVVRLLDTHAIYDGSAPGWYFWFPAGKKVGPFENEHGCREAATAAEQRADWLKTRNP